MKEWMKKSMADLAADNRQDQGNVKRLLGEVCDWIESQQPFNALNWFDRDEVNRQVEQLRAEQDPAGKLYGVPILIKDNIAVKNWPTTAASKILKGYRSNYDATIISRLKKQGAIFIGRANMDEFAMGSSGENSADGPARNPWDRDRVPGGSSSGSAVGAAIGLGCAALGSDTGGSIRLPASFCGVVGLKPTYGRVSRYGLLALGSSLDQIGPLSRRVGDAALMLQVMAGLDERDATTREQPVDNYYDEINNFNSDIKIGLVTEMYEQAEEPIKKVMDEVISQYAKAGIVVEKVSIPILKYSIPVYYIIQSSECSANLARYDGIRYGRSAENNESIEDLLTLYMKTRGEGFGSEVKRRIMLGTYSLSSGYYDDYFKRAAKVRTRIINEFDNLFTEYDLLLGLTAPTVAFKIGEKIDDPLSMYLSDIMTIGVSMAGLPAISLPAGFSQGLPVGVQLIGPKWSELKLLQTAQWLEEKYHWDKYIPTEIKILMEE